MSKSHSAAIASLQRTMEAKSSTVTWQVCAGNDDDADDGNGGDGEDAITILLHPRRTSNLTRRRGNRDASQSCIAARRPESACGSR